MIFLNRFFLFSKFILILFLLCGFTLFKKTDKSDSLPSSLFQKPVSFSSEDPKAIQKQLSSISKTYSSQAVEWWILYKKALLFKDTTDSLFCHNMKFLSQISSFPLKDYAYLHLYTHCESKTEINLTRFPDWLKQKALKAWHSKAKEQKLDQEIKESAYLLYQSMEEKNEKEKYLIIAIEKGQEGSRSSMEKVAKGSFDFISSLYS